MAARFDFSTVQPLESEAPTREGRSDLEPRSRLSRLAREIRSTVLDPWHLAGTVALLFLVFGFAYTVTQARHLKPTGKTTLPLILAVVTSPSPSDQASPTSEPAPAPQPSASAAPPDQRLPLAGAPAPTTSSATRRAPVPTARPAPTPKPTALDRPPTALLMVTADGGLSVTADAGASWDPDPAGIASYQFNFGDGITVGPQAGASAGHRYGGAGTYTVTVIVVDAAGLFSSASFTVTVT